MKLIEGHVELLGRALRTFQPIARRRRMKKLERMFSLQPGARVLDLGGSTTIWEHVQTPLDVTIVNLPGSGYDRTQRGRHKFTFVEADATALGSIFSDRFDLVFSNSCIEHVGGAEKQAAFAGEVKRLSGAYYVQTPARGFPIEAHTGLPFWWFYPKAVKRAFYSRWREKVPAWSEMIEGTTVLSRASLRTYFPDGKLEVERMMMLPKSYVIWKK